MNLSFKKISIFTIFLLSIFLFPNYTFGQLFIQDSIIIRAETDTIYYTNEFPPIPEIRIKEPKIALVLSGGGARGLAHIGVIDVFEKHKIPIHAIYGTSIGAVIGGLYSIGYSTDDLKSLLKSVDITSFFSINKEIKREYLYQDQKLSFSKSFFTLRFQNFKPVIPSSLTSGHELTNLINGLVLQGLHHTEKFDDLPIKFFPVVTDLSFGKSIALNSGNLSEAIRASFTWPLLNPPIIRDSLKLIDGGILANIPAHFPINQGYDLVISVNTTSGLKRKEDINSTIDILDQMLSIMQAEFDNRELKSSDVVISPNLQRYSAVSFNEADSIIFEGEKAAIENIEKIIKKRESLINLKKSNKEIFVSNIFVNSSYLPNKLEQQIKSRQIKRTITENDIYLTIRELKKLGFYQDVFCKIITKNNENELHYYLNPYPFIKSVFYTGDSLISKKYLDSMFSIITEKPFNHSLWLAITDSIIKTYRNMGLSLAKIYKVDYDSTNNFLEVYITEGRINKVNVIGNNNIKDYVILREFPLKNGDLFNINQATRGLSNLVSSDLFENVIIDINYIEQKPDINIKVTEKPFEIMRVGIRVDNEKHSQLYIDFRNENLFSGGAEYGINFQGGFKNVITSLDFKTNKIFNTPFYLKTKFKYQFEDQYTYKNAPIDKSNRWKREEIGEFREIKYGPSITFGGLYKKIGFLYGEYKYEHQKIIRNSGTGFPEGKHNISSIKAGIIFDSQDLYPFPKKGMLLNSYHEISTSAIGTGIPFTKTFFSYELYITARNTNTFHPKIIFGYGDNTLPYTEQFKLGGQNSFFGLRDNEFRGRQIFVTSLEYRWLLPNKIFFDTYISLRYDLGSVWEKTEAIKIDNLRHGLGLSFALDTPVGPAIFSFGNSFLFNRSLPNNPFSFGPLFFYFSLGYTLD